MDIYSIVITKYNRQSIEFCLHRPTTIAYFIKLFKQCFRRLDVDIKDIQSIKIVKGYWNILYIYKDHKQIHDINNICNKTFDKHIYKSKAGF